MPKPHNQAQNTRRFFQTLFFLLFLYLFSKTLFPLESRIPVDLFLRADPLIALSTAISLRSASPTLVLFALPVVVLTLLFGRVFCGWICPMGATLDLSEKIFRWRRRKQERTRPEILPRLKRLKYYLLAGLLLTAIFVGDYRGDGEFGLIASLGLPLTYLFDPIALITRSFALGLFAPLQNLLTTLHVDQALAKLTFTDFALEHESLRNAIVGVQRALAIRVDAPGIRPFPLVFRLAPVVFLIFAGIVALNSISRRFWCRYICPLGAMLGILARWAPTRLRVGDSCIDCGTCIRRCRTAAITPDPKLYAAAECVSCHECISICPKGSISFTPKPAPASNEPRLDLSRRRLLQAAGLGVASVTVLKSDWGAKYTEGAKLKVSAAGLIRPPGALPEAKFLAACVRCGECMKVCPTNGLQPALGEGGLEALGTPILVPRIGPCTQHCNACGQLCPTKAIEPFEIEEKAWLNLGTAVIDRNMCIAWAHDKICSVCDESCPYDAIRQQFPDAPVGIRPIVEEWKCVGCGQCERACPVAPQAAIRVYSKGDTRHLPRAQRRENYETYLAYELEESSDNTDGEEPYGGSYPY